uniref:NADH-ubiquinone oxidoreductase chain 6 n=1 Tax=Lysmata amboinensis TaxID=575568 RepID=A0A7G7WQG0_9EUCA|nr:NADH dehydrogenase subunit 6 [Lysmata amboinensis]QNH68787.1 NADH dehydrogenase subunit 6 [Lysmata amboinensis]
MSLMTISLSLTLLISALSISFTKMSSPLAMGLVLLTQTILICLITGASSKSVWFSYILFLIFLGAMLVLFIYVASLASNEQFFFSPKMTTSIPLIILTSLLMALFLDPLPNPQPINIEQSSTLLTETLNSSFLIVSMIYSSTSMNLTIFVVLYLLLTLIVVVKITGFFYGPLRLS